MKYYLLVLSNEKSVYFVSIYSTIFRTAVEKLTAWLIKLTRL